MKTTVVPAQIITLEDRIAGNLSFTQIVLLIIPLLIGTGIYVIEPPRMHFVAIKVILIILQFMFFGVLAIRINGKILADWLVIYLRFKARPRKYIFTKNDIDSRDMYIPEPSKIDAEKEIKHKKINKTSQALGNKEKDKIERLLKDKLVSLSFKIAKKGDIDVTLKSVRE